MSVKISDAEAARRRAGSSVARRDQAHARAHHGEQPDIGARHAAVQDVAADRHRETLERAPTRRIVSASSSAWVGCSWLPSPALTTLQSSLRDSSSAAPAVLVAHHEDVGPHGVERRGGVDQRLALGDRGGRDGHVEHVGAQPLGRQLEGALGAGRGLEEQIDQRAPAQDVALLARDTVGVGELIGEIEKEIDLFVRRAPRQ